MKEQGLNILVADDSSAIRSVVKSAASLIPDSVRFLETDNGKSCMESLATGHFDIAFVDVHMPELSGLEALALARRDNNETFVVFMSGNQNEEIQKIAKSLNAYDFLKKPFQVSDIADTVKNFCRLRKSSNVLVVDDSRTVRTVIRKVLAKSLFRMKIVEAENGQTALDIYRNEPVDIVFLDVNMPGISGIETLHELRKLNSRARVVLMTADKSDELANSVAALNVDCFLYKPFFAQDVNRALHQLFGLRMPELSLLEAG